MFESRYVCSRVLKFLLLKRWTHCVCKCTNECFGESGSEVFFASVISQKTALHLLLLYSNIFVAFIFFLTTTEEVLMHRTNFIFSLFLLTYLHLLLDTCFSHHHNSDDFYAFTDLYTLVSYFKTPGN